MKTNKDIYIGETGIKIESIVPYILYNNSTGTNGSITLSDSSANYSYLEIYFCNNDNIFNSVKVYQPNGKIVQLSSNTPVGTSTYFKNRTVYISDNSITTKENWYSESYISTGAYSSSLSNLIYITKVIGYK